MTALHLSLLKKSPRQKKEKPKSVAVLPKVEEEEYCLTDFCHEYDGMEDESNKFIKELKLYNGSVSYNKDADFKKDIYAQIGNDRLWFFCYSHTIVRTSSGIIMEPLARFRPSKKYSNLHVVKLDNRLAIYCDWLINIYENGGDGFTLWLFQFIMKYIIDVFEKKPVGYHMFSYKLKSNQDEDTIKRHMDIINHTKGLPFNCELIWLNKEHAKNPRIKATYDSEQMKSWAMIYWKDIVDLYSCS